MTTARGSPMTERKSIKQIAAEIQSGRTVVRVVEESLALAEGLNPEHRSFITIVRDAALSQAAKADARRQRSKQHGLLDGVPFAAKDMFETAGIPTTGGSPVLKDNVPETSALVVARLEEAGSVLIGKANQHEFAYGATGENGWSGTTRNPLDTTRLAGGSSGGSAAAVAAGIVPYALGTDTGGSVRVPAALCGVVGFKPSFGRMSLQGVIPYCWSLDHAGIFANNVEDVAVVFGQTTSVGQAAVPKNFKVGIVKGWAERSDTPVRQAFSRAKFALEQMGASFTEIELPDQAEARTVSLTIQLAETLAYHGPNLARDGASFGKDMLSGMALGQFISAESYVQCKRMLEVYNRAFTKTMSNVDLLLTPGCPITAPKIGAVHVEVGGDSLPVGNALTLFTSFFNLVGAPAIALPVHEETSHLPVSVQLVGGRNRDFELLATANAFEDALRATKKIAA